MLGADFTGKFTQIPRECLILKGFLILREGRARRRLPPAQSAQAMEQLLHYVWKHKILPLRELFTTDGRRLEVVSPGMHNGDAGPDFFNAKVKIGGRLWVGNVEVHTRASDWYRHRHHADAAYASVVLHVVGEADTPVAYPGDPGRLIPQFVLPVPDHVRRNYERLSRSDAFPRCRGVVASLPPLRVHGWLSALRVERLEERTAQIAQRRQACGMSWEDTLFVTVARHFGFGINGDAFERWAQSVPLGAVAKHRDSLFQVEAVFFGQAGFLEEEGHGSTDYFARLRREYAHLRRKFSLAPIDVSAWRFLRLRPQNFPHVRIAQLAMLYCERRLTLARLIDAPDVPALHALLDTRVSDFWQTHYTFRSQPSARADRKLSIPSKNLLIVNAVSSMLFAYGRYKSDTALCDRAVQLLEQLEPERNAVVAAWREAGVACETAADSQALLQLTRRYCEPRDCLRCRFGYEYMRRTPGFLCEGE